MASNDAPATSNVRHGWSPQTEQQGLAPTLAPDKVLLVNLSGRGDKDMNTVAEKSGLTKKQATAALETIKAGIIDGSIDPLVTPTA